MSRQIVNCAFLFLMLTAVLCGIHSEASADTIYLFTSFRGNGDGLHLAASDDGYKWTELPGIFLEPTVGSKLMRDPHLLPGPDGVFRLVWTTGWNDQGIGYASSKDLVNWSEQKYIPVMEDTPGTKNCWCRKHSMTPVAVNTSLPGHPMSKVVFRRPFPKTA